VYGGCSQCRDHFILKSEFLCEKIIYLVPELLVSGIGNILRLDFKSEAQQYLKYFLSTPQALSLNIDGFKPDEFTFQPSFSNDTDLILSIKPVKNIPKSTKITVEIKSQDWMIKDALKVLTKFVFDITTTDDYILCSSTQAYDRG
jgi:hypothetical protein